MNTAAITIQGKQFTVGQPYTAGHTIDEAEAHALNQVRAENIRNNFGAQMKSAAEEGKELTQDDLAKYDAEYKFGVRSGGVRVDPVTSESRRLARQAIEAKLKEKGHKLKDVPKDHMEKLVNEAAPRFRAKAEEVIAARKAAVADLGDLNLDVAA